MLLEQGLPLSSIECIEEEGRLHDEQRVCWFRNVFYRQGRLHYVSPDTNVTLPRIAVRFGVNDNSTGFLNPVVIRPEDVELNETEVIMFEEDTEVYMWSTIPESNWGHLVGEYQPTLHSTLCKYMGHCRYRDRHKVQLLEIFPNAPKWADWLVELDKCFSSKPKITIHSPDYHGKVVYIKKGLAGVGAECRARLFCSGEAETLGGHKGHKPMQPAMMASHRQRMAQCLGFDAGRTARVEPLRMVVVDRHYRSARHILNIAEIMDVLHQRYDDLADISLHYMEGLGPREQIQLWSKADIVIHMHGAALGSWIFLPKNAVVVHIVPQPGGIIHDNSFAEQLVADLNGVTNVTYLPVNNTDMAYAHFKKEVISQHEEWKALSPEEKVKILEEGTCSHLPEGPRQYHCLMWWFLKNINLVLKPELLVPQVDAAIADLYSKLDRRLPEGFPNTLDLAPTN
ncbi:hypothetical protein N2152v2_008984 [Parachlorella kessleri]